ncbi:cholinesterase 1-like [Actinia tenebrosa]|uniref:Cholinesterase 1-like n=1 Tax=Actinia tenebrosa TaxID=6105 RepID=A0A6P8I091_ACTTE|nr:cholinesterase 1-like [Actinia tenebrosa]
MLLLSKRVVLFLTLHLFHEVVLGSKMNHRRVLTQQGYVRGIRQDIQTNNGQAKTVYKFLGVPYVEKPIGDLRFKPPQALSTRRSSDYDATSVRPICMQDEYYFDSIRGAWPEFDPKRDMSEDCLYLNIYTQSTRGKKKYPVIFYIHGGGYFSGSPTRDTSPGEYLPTRGVVLVTIQYRLGPFGFFTTGDSEAPGNVGLLDQVEALKWVQRNIEGFCGDKNSVTLLGESAGGSSVGLHYLSPLSRGLFHRGIAVSGVDLCPFAHKPKSTVLEYSKELVRKVNCSKATSRQILQCLKSVSSATFFNNRIYWLMQPFVDQRFLPDEPKILRKRGKFYKLPLMSGFVSQEGSFVVDLYSKNYNTTYNSTGLGEYLDNVFLPIEYNCKKDKAYVAYNALKFQYTPWDDLNNRAMFRHKLTEMWSDYFFIAPTDAALTIHSDHGDPTYMFEFAHRSRYHPKPEWMGVIHEDTTAYKFGLPLLNSKTRLKFDKKDKKVSDMVVTMFTNFAKFGNPTPRRVRGLKWDNFDSSKKAYLKIKENSVMTSKYHPLRMAFWNSYFLTLLPKKPLPPSGGKDSVVSDAAVNMNYGKLN